LLVGRSYTFNLVSTVPCEHTQRTSPTATTLASALAVPALLESHT